MIMNDEKGAQVNNYRDLYKHKDEEKNMKSIKVFIISMRRSLKSSI